MSKTWTREMLAAVIDHILLKVTATSDQIVSICQEARQYGFAAVCVNPFYVPLACELAIEAGAHYVKTSTGFGTGGAGY